MLKPFNLQIKSDTGCRQTESETILTSEMKPTGIGDAHGVQHHMIGGYAAAIEDRHHICRLAQCSSGYISDEYTPLFTRKAMRSGFRAVHDNAQCSGIRCISVYRKPVDRIRAF